ncbi:hypothetical protein [Sabulicella glaciei]|uniref:Uncharacterized protein n=1 Tax=Sabulicella glaciei TaxID=2984948 RepID=A0ABT3NR74_9PROT|nr:hypothetical protein [Roseococcus sp. MDT2-1-1]MCW8084663.1 hypothetical protein [Roseococcus sp. MDT2-1-1]
MKTLRFLAPAVVGAALLGPAAGLAQMMDRPAIAPGVTVIVPGHSGMAHGHGQMVPMDHGPATMGAGYGAGQAAPPGYTGRMVPVPEPSAGDRMNYEMLREQERQAWERERAELIRRGYGVPSTQQR